MALTIGQVSAIIAAVIFVFQFLVPNAVTLILVGVLRQTHSAVTWSVVQRNIFSSHWPLLTNSDSTATRGVDAKVRFITFLKPIGLFLISLAAVVTPLGLHDNIRPSPDTDQVAFEHLPDSGPFGYASMSRDGQSFTRICNERGVLLPCPGSQTQLDFTTNILNQITNTTLAPGTTYDINVPQSLIDLYQSGLSTQPASVASFFDIESRLYTYTNGSRINNGERYIVDTFKMLQSIILDDTIRPIEGLIANVRNGGIGFRNHSVPRGVDLGAEWTEELLFIEPETECVNTNLTYEFTISNYGASEYSNEDLVLVDEGGFINLNQTYPTVDLSDPQKNPNLRERAYKAAWLTNVYNMVYMNITRPNPRSFAYLNSTLGKRFPLDSSLSTSASANSISVTDKFSAIYDPGFLTENSSFFSNSTPKPLYSNPFKISSENYTDIQVLCQGAGSLDLTNATNIHVECGLIFGAARPVDGTEAPIVPFPYTVWRQPIYACASANKASIKQVTFHYNTSLAHDVSSLSIIKITDKVYPDEDSMPRWGVETVDFQLNQLAQLWGLISEENAGAPNITTFKAPYMRLPGFEDSIANELSTANYIPGHHGPGQALGGTYDQGFQVYDWTGQSNVAMMQRWRQLTDSTEGAAHIANLIWTDLAANKMTSSKNWNQHAVRTRKRDTSGTAGQADGYATVPVTKFERRVQYKWAYAAPAFIVLALSVAVIIVAVVLSVVKHSGLHHVRYYTDSLSSGRLLVAAQYPGSVDKLAPTRVWVNSAGKYQTSLGPMTYGQYQQTSSPYPPPPPPPLPPTQQVQQHEPALPTSEMPIQQSSPPATAYQNAYMYGGYQQIPLTDTGYVGANAPWSEKGYENVNSMNEIPLMPGNTNTRSDQNGYFRMNNK